MAYASNTISVESGNNPFAKNPRSSATGAGQFIDSTWLSLIHKYRPDLEQGRSRQEILGLRTNPDLSKEMVDNYGNENAQFLSQKGLPVTEGTKYLAHFAGPRGAAVVLGSPPSAPVASILGEGAVAANPFLKNMTAGQLAEWANRKMGIRPTDAPVPGQATQAPPLPPPVTVGPAPNIGTGFQAPMAGFAQSPAATPQTAPQFQMPQAQPLSAPEIQYAPRQFNPLIAFNKIPLPAGFRGFRYA